MSDATLKSVRLLKHGSGQYLWRPSLDDGAPNTLLGSPVRTSSGMPEAGASAMTVLYGNFSYVTVADRGPTVVQRLNELYAANREVGFCA